MRSFGDTYFLGYDNFFVYEGFLLIPINTMLQSYLGTLAKFLRAGMGPTDCIWVRVRVPIELELVL